MKSVLGKNFFLAVLLSLNTAAHAAVYALPSQEDSLIGSIKIINASAGDNVVTVASRYDIGFNSIQNSNPDLEMTSGFPLNSTVVVPMEYLLPEVSREGIVVNLPEMRMYYFPKGSQVVQTFPIGIGKIGKTIPIVNTSIVYKRENPTWTPPQDIRDFNLKQGIILPKTMPAGPDNPLGKYAIYMKLPTYLIHSTIFPESVGTRASFGCIRMYESDIETLFPIVSPGIPVTIINVSTKFGWQQHFFYLEMHHPLEEYNDKFDISLPGVVHNIIEKTKNYPTLIDWQAVSFINKEKDGIPHNIGFIIS